MRTCVSECDVCKARETLSMLDDIDSMYDAPPQPTGWTRIAVVMDEPVIHRDQDEIAEAAREFEGAEGGFMAALIRSKAVLFSTTFDICPACLQGALGPLHAPLLQRLKDRTDRPEPPAPPIIPFPSRVTLSSDEALDGEDPVE